MSYLMSRVGPGLPNPGFTELISLRLSQGSQQFYSDFLHTDGPLVSSEIAERGLAWCYSSRLGGQKPGGHRCPLNCIESISCHLNPVSFIIQLRVYFGDSICRVHDTHSKLVCIISVHLLEDRCSHHKNQQPHRQ